MPIGRISGPLLAQNLFRDNIDIAFYNINSAEDPILYLSVDNGRVGIGKNNPQYSLDVKGTVNGDVLRIIETTTGTTGYGQIGKIFIQTGTISSVDGPINIDPAAANEINLRGSTTVYGNFHSTGNITADGDIGLGNVPTDRLRITAEIASNLIPNVDNTYDIGSSTSGWQDAYINQVYAEKLRNKSGSLVIEPQNGQLDINGQIRVFSPFRPLGTGPVVTNTLYVTVDGDDTNDGTAMDASRACRTISGAIKSPFYKPGTTIRVQAGRYLENNPILLQPFTSVVGSDLRTTFIIPINKTQDLFHVQSGCYIAQLQMSGGRSGLLPIENANGYNRGAYATAFPPQVGGKKIDIVRSPYIQNCTNESGPWLKDGTMFLPNQTVQIPSAVGTGTWVANTNSFNVSVSTGTIVVGDSVNAGPQNPGFYEARTLILANKSFIQEQVINYISNKIITATTGSIWYNFTYLKAKCYRDTGIIVENVSYDSTFGGNEKSIESGLAYFKGVISLIAGQEAQTIEAINHINTLTQQIITNTTVTTIGVVTNPQIINTALTNGSVAGPGFQRNIKIITDIISTGATAAPPMIKSQGPDAYIISAETLLQSNRAFIQNEVTAFTDITYSSINYNVDKCRRDINLIIDSVGLDILYPTAEKSQSTFAGLQYWDQGGYTGIIDQQITTTTNAIRYLNYLAQEVAQNITTGARFGVATVQYLEITHGYPGASESEAARINTLFETILTILQNGTIGVSDIIDFGSGYPTTDTATVRAASILNYNKTYLQDEVIAWLERNSTPGYATTALKNRCRVDVGYIVDSICFDLLHGGNKQSVQSAVYYWGYSTSTSAIIGTIPQTVYAYNTLTSLVSDIVQNVTITPTQTKFTQSTTATAVDATAATYVTGFLIEILDIIQNGPSAAAAKVPISLTRTANADIENAYRNLQNNKNFIREEVISRTNAEFFRQNTYNRDKCRRDAGLIIDAVVLDILFPTLDNSQTTFAGLQYWNQTGATTIPGNQFTATVAAFTYAKDLCKKLVVNDTSNPRYSGSAQNTTYPEATLNEATLIEEKFAAFFDILTTGTTGVTDKIIPNGISLPFNENMLQAADILKYNKSYIQDEVIAYITYFFPALSYDEAKCRRDTGYIIDSISFDMLYGGNKQSIQCGVYYYGFSAGDSAIYGQTTATIAAYNRIRTLIPDIAKGIAVTPLQAREEQIFETFTLNTTTIAAAVGKVDVITYIIQNGPTAPLVAPPSPITTTATNDVEYQKLATALFVNRQFLAEEVVEYVDQNFALNYNRNKCSRDAGLIVDAITYDLIVGGNTKSIEAGISYWQGTRSYITGQIPQTVAAVERARLISLDIIRNIPVTRTVGNGTEQIINTYFDGGQAADNFINMNYTTIKNIMQNGESVAPRTYVGGGLFAETGISNNDTKLAPKVRSVVPVAGNVYRVTLDTATIGAASNATLYFGEVLVFPKNDNEFSAQERLDWGMRMVDPTGSMGGSLVDGGVVSERSPINSFVYDAFTQVNQGGRGIHIINNGYAQLVSVFTIFCSTHVEVTNGGIASITNSNANFGTYCLVARGKGPLEFAGTVYNPAYPSIPQTAGRSDKGEYYPNGFWPDNAEVLIYISDTTVRPHIGLVMEIVPPLTVMEDISGFPGTFVEKIYTNEQGLPGFLNAAPDINLLTTGSITITGIDTTGIAIGHTLYVRDQFGSFKDNAGINYSDTGTLVTDVGFQSVTLNKALLSGGGEEFNPVFFTLLFCGNAYYNVLTSNTTTSVIPGETSTLRDPIQEAAEIDAIIFLNYLIVGVVRNDILIASPGASYFQNRSAASAEGASAFVNARINEIQFILQNYPNNIPETRKTGTPPPQASEATLLIELNRDFIVQEITYRVSQYPGLVLDSRQQYKCKETLI